MKNFFKGKGIFHIDTNAIPLPFSIQRFAESETDSSAGTLKLVGNIINLIGLKSLAQQLNDELKDNKNSVTLSPALSFITSFLYEEADILDSDQTMRKTYLGSYATLITTLISTIDNACIIIIEFENEVPSKSKISSSLASIATGIGSIGQAIANINDLKINAYPKIRRRKL